MMTEHTSTSLHDLVVRTFAAVEAKDVEAMMSLLADDAVIIDPHFPTPQMQGKVAITEAFRGGDEWHAVIRLHHRELLRVRERAMCGSRDGNTPCPDTRNEAKLPPGLH